MGANTLKNSEIKLIGALPKSLQSSVVTNLQSISIAHLFRIIVQNDDRNWHIEDNYILSYCLAGNKTLFIGDRQLNCGPGEAVILPANIRHRFCVSENHAKVLLFCFCSPFSINTLKRIIGETFIPRADERKILFECVRAFGVPDNDCEASYFFAIALHRIIRRAFSDPADNVSLEYGDEKIQRANQIIQENLHRQITLAELAKAVNVSVSTLQKRFYAKMKCGIGKYIFHQRMLKASKLLRSTGMNISEIAFATGFESETTFRRAFKRETGYAPSLIRQIAHGITFPGVKLKSNGFPDDGRA